MLGFSREVCFNVHFSGAVSLSRLFVVIVVFVVVIVECLCCYCGYCNSYRG